MRRLGRMTGALFMVGVSFDPVLRWRLWQQLDRDFPLLGAIRFVDGPGGADRIFYAATGQPLITAGEVTKLVMELVPGSKIEIADMLTPDDEMEASFRGVISIANAIEQLGWNPVYASVRDGIGEYVSRYRAFLATAAVREGR